MVTALLPCCGRPLVAPCRASVLGLPLLAAPVPLRPLQATRSPPRRNPDAADMRAADASVLSRSAPAPATPCPGCSVSLRRLCRRHHCRHDRRRWVASAALLRKPPQPQRGPRAARGQRPDTAARPRAAARCVLRDATRTQRRPAAPARYTLARAETTLPPPPGALPQHWRRPLHVADQRPALSQWSFLLVHQPHQPRRSQVPPREPRSVVAMR